MHDIVSSLMDQFDIAASRRCVEWSKSKADHWIVDFEKKRLAISFHE